MFKFRLESVLKYRSRIVEKFQRELAAVNNVLQQGKDELETLRNKEKSNSKDYGHKLDKLLLEEMILYDNYFSGTLIEIESQKLLIADAQKKADVKRSLLIESVKQKKIIEKLKEKGQAEYIQIEKKKEEASLDEVAVIKFKQGSSLG